MHGEGTEEILWRSFFRVQASDERLLLTSQDHAFERVAAAFGRLCTNIRWDEEAHGWVRGDWPKRRPTHQLEARLRELAPGNVRVVVFAHPSRLAAFRGRRCHRAVRRLVHLLIYDD